MKYYRELIFALLLFTFSMNVSIAGLPPRARLTASIVINAPADEVWAIIKNFDNMYWHPNIFSITTDKKNSGNSIRTLTLDDGRSITEEMKLGSYKAEKMSYKYNITEMSTEGIIDYAGIDVEIPAFPVTYLSAKLSIKSIDGKSLVTWTATYYPGLMFHVYIDGSRIELPAALHADTGDEAIANFFIEGLLALAWEFDTTVSISNINLEIRR